MMTRRKFLESTALGLTGMALPFAAFKIIDPRKLMAREASDTSKVRWVFLVDTYKCVGCGLCVKACKEENEIPYDANVTRTWVERYVLTKTGGAAGGHPEGRARRLHHDEDRDGSREVPGGQKGGYR